MTSCASRHADAGTSTPRGPLPRPRSQPPEELAATGTLLLGVDLNADHLAACVIDPHGNPVGQPLTVTTDLTGPASRRDGRLRAAISDLIHLAREHDCAAVALEKLGFDD